MNFLKLFFLTALFSFAAFSQTAPPESDFQFWNETQLQIPLVKTKDNKGKEVEKITLFINGTLRVGENYKRFVDERIGFGFDFKINKYLTLTPSYLYRAEQPFGNRKAYESRFRFAGTLENKWSRFSLKDRNLVEYRMRNSRSDSVRYRNKLQINVPVVKNKKELFTPFIADEVFYDFQLKKWARNEVSAGISKKFTPNFSADFYYLYRRDSPAVWKNVHALGINLKFKIDRK